MSERTTARPVRRQARGERRIATLLDAAAEVFAESGYEAATTNAIAARADASPGTLYQFFPNKEAIAAALAERYVGQLQAIYDVAFAPDVARLPLATLIDRVLDPLVSFNVANPGFAALLAGPTTPEHLAAAAQRLHTAVLERMDALLASFTPNLPAARRQRCGQVSVQLVKAFMPTIRAVDGAERDALVTELKKVLQGYLGPLADPTP